jgi:hypothetical protein
VDVSIRARQLRQANRHYRPSRAAVRRVSIRARQLRRANRGGHYRINPQAEFQSAPANCGGRIAVTVGTCADSRNMFQSAPANCGGRIQRRPARSGTRLAVSIRARQLRRANPLISRVFGFSATVSIRARQLRRANPVERRRTHHDVAVSIRARQLRRANHSLQRSSVTGGGKCPLASIARICGTISATVARNAAVIATSRRRRELW